MVTTVPTITLYGGDTAIWPTYTFTDGQGHPRNLVTEGWGSWEAQWRPRAESSSSVHLSVDASNAANGVIKISCSAVDTGSMLTGGIWDLQATNGSTVKTWLRGKTKLVRDVTHG